MAVTLLAGAFVLVAILRASLERGVTNTAIARATDVASLAKAGTLPAALAFPGEERSIIQVTDPSGRVVASTANIAGEPAIVASSTTPYTTSDLPVGERQRFRVTVSSVDVGGGRYVIVAGESLERVDATVRTVRLALGTGLPVFVILVAGLAIAGTRRALRPVEAIRAEVAEITESDLHRRVPVPNGGDEIAHLASTMNAMLDRLETASERQSRFVADASHELRSPLTSLRALLEIGLARPNRLDWPNRAEGALAEVDRLERLVRDLLTLSGATSTDPTRWEHCDLGELIADEVARSSVGSLVPITFVGDGPVLVRGDPEQLGRAVGNLLTNAARHAVTAVEVRARIADGDVVVEVSDDGAGVALTDRHRVFERFVRLDEARATDDGGSGLGLSIVRSIAVAHGGSVSIVGGPPGAVFQLRLPAVDGRRTAGDIELS